MKKYNRIISEFRREPMAILPDKLAEISAFLLHKSTQNLFDDAGGDDAQREAYGAFGEAKARPSATMQGSVAVIPLFGVLAPRMNMLVDFSGGTSMEQFAKKFQALVDDPSVKAVVINVDSPGGTVYGTQELADIVYAARGKKHIVAIANNLAASAAYWIASAADELVVTPSGEVGSIGVIYVHEDYSKAFEDAGVKPTLIRAGEYKYEGNEYEPLSDEAKAFIQQKVNKSYDAFIAAVSRNRGVATKVVKSDFGQGRVMMAADAKAAGLVDRIDTLDGVIARLGGSNVTMQATARISHDVAQKRLEVALA